MAKMAENLPVSGKAAPKKAIKSSKQTKATAPEARRKPMKPRKPTSSESEDDFAPSDDAGSASEIEVDDDEVLSDGVDEEDEAILSEEDEPTTTKFKRAQPNGRVNGKNRTGNAPNVNGRAFQNSKDAPHLSNLPPISDIPSMFADLVSRLPPIVTVAEKLKGRKLRVATMCSGTESPLLALGLSSRALREQRGVDLEIDHVFSCEIEPYKQAYIERNFRPPILFRDVTELGNDFAHTAYGARVRVPGNVDVLIAGTSCVDYSTLNNEKQDIDANGESGRTFRGMLEWVKKHQPTIVLLENVCGAPWDRVVQKFEGVNYSAVHMRLDTKNYYIPHTRTRGYLMAINKKGSGIPAKWKQQVTELARPASSTLDAFLLPSDDPRIHTARQKLVHEGAIHERKAGYDWGKCESRHVKARHEEQLGNRRPLTGWDESGNSKLPSFAWNDWSKNQVERVWDLMDITTLRAATLGKDPLYKTEVWNLSQNVDRQIGSSRIGIAPCLTPTMIPYVTNRGGPMVGIEALGLQGLPVDELLLTRETEDQLADLAGNAMPSTVVGSAILSALVVSMKYLEPGKEEDAMDVDDEPVPIIIPSPSTDDLIKGDEQLVQKEVDLGDARAHSLPALLVNAISSVRLCDCEGRDDIKLRAMLRCKDCGGTACIKCGGRPEHNYDPIDFVATPRLAPYAFRKALRDQIPMVLSVAGITTETLETARSSVIIDDKTWPVWKQAVLDAVASNFEFKEDKRQETWIIVYESSTSVLYLHLHPLRPEWTLYAKPFPSEPANSPVRTLLSRPVARLVSHDTLFGGVWELALPVERTISIEIEGTGELVPSWESNLGLEGSEFKNKKVWSKLNIKVAGNEDVKAFDRDLSGSYTLLDKCGSANSALHIKDPVDSEKGLPPLFLFLDPTRCGDPKEDPFVFSSSTRRTEYGEPRLIVASLNPEWRTSSDEGTQTVESHVYVHWTAVQAIKLKPVAELKAIYSIPAEALQLSVSKEACQSANAILVCEVPVNPESASRSWPRDKWNTVDHIHERATFNDLSWLTDRVRSLPHADSWNSTSVPEDHSNCERCAPTAPAIRWVEQKGRIVAEEDPSQAGQYERALKQRPSPFVTQLKLDTEAAKGTVRIGINVASLMHRALSRLPHNDTQKPELSWRLTTDYTPPARLSLPKFRLTGNRQDKPHAQPPNFELDLRPEQLRSLEWMMHQESKDAHPFIEEEISEAILKPLGWRVEGKARRPVRVSGGVLADQVGYGKTAITLGLIDSTYVPGAGRKKALTPAGKIRVNGTLVAVPAHLTRQWKSEIQKFTGKQYQVLVLENMSNFNKTTIQDIIDADIIVVASRLVNSETYLNNFQEFAASGKIPNKEGRYFDARLQRAHETLKGQAELLTSKTAGPSAVYDKIVNVAVNHKEEVLTKKRRLKGKQYRDRVHEDTVLGSSSAASSPPPSSPPSSSKASPAPRSGLIPEVVINSIAKSRGVRKDNAIIISDNSDSDKQFSAKVSQLKLQGKTKRTHPQALSDAEASDSDVPPSKKSAKGGAKKAAPVKKRKIASREPSDEAVESDEPAMKKRKTGASKAKPVKEKNTKASPHEADPWKLKTKKVKDNWKEMSCPPLELFHFNRIVIDEYTYLEGKMLSLITSLHSNHRWILSGTPPTQDFASVKTIASFMGLHLGIDDNFWEGQSKAALSKAKRRQKDQTSVESFHSFREVHSLDWHAHRHEVAQTFLDQFVRQNIAEIDEIPFETHKQKIILPAAERAIYLELEHHLRALDMTIRKGKKKVESDREKRMAESLGNSKSAEEALLKRCSHFELEETVKDNALKACEVIVRDRTRQLNECEADIATQIAQAFQTEKKLGSIDYDSHFRRWLRMSHVEGGIGDDDAKKRLHDIQVKAGYKYSSSEQDKPRPNLDQESPKVKDARWAHREHSHVLKKLEKELVGRVRSLRYFTIVRDLQQHADTVEHVSCPVCGKQDLPITDIAILSSCGHAGCHLCVFEKAGREECVARENSGCASIARLTGIVKAETLGEDEERSVDKRHFGMKLEKVLSLIKDKISKEDRILVFVQFPDLMEKVAEALNTRNIQYLQIKGSNTAKAKALEEFQARKERVLLLNVGDESASGANLTVANHVIFLSPLLTPYQQFYDATEVQAIGRVRRFGQSKMVHIYRFLTLNSIDVEIYEARSGDKVE